jgi:hypothetical protein
VGESAGPTLTLSKSDDIVTRIAQRGPVFQGFRGSVLMTFPE